MVSSYPINAGGRPIANRRLLWELVETAGFPPVVSVKSKSVTFESALTLGQHASLHAIVEQHLPIKGTYDARFKAAEYDERGRLSCISHYQEFDGTSPSCLAKRADFVYDGSELDRVEVVEYYIDGAIKDKRIVEYTTLYTQTGLGTRTTRISPITEE